MSAKLVLKVETKLDELGRIAAAVEDFGEREDWPTEIIFRVNLALEELGINIMNYGHDGGFHEFEIALTSEADSITIEITDDGRAFNPLNDATMPDITAPMEDRTVGGLGIHLVRTMMDEMIYRREHCKNHLFMIIRRVE